MSTICAISTAKGGAIGVIRVSGPESIKFTDKIFRSPKGITLEESKPYTLHFGHIIKSSIDAAISAHDFTNSDIIDEVLVTTYRSPHSYTGEDSTEIMCHGSQYILQSVIELLIAQGCRLANPGEYTQRAFLNGKMDLSQAEAVADLIASSNAASHRVAMNQMRGGFSRKLQDLRSQLLHLTSLMELELDFSDHEDVEFVDRSDLLSLAKDIEQEILRLSASFSLGNALKNGIPVAIIGAPNVGKSTLLNLLLGEDKAIVSDIQGTTRDIIEDTLTIQGVTFRFIDTAGLRRTDDTIEKIGIERSLKAAEKSHIILLISEPGVPYPDIKVRKDQKVIKILNKSEHFQALTGIGLEWLHTELLKAAPHCSDDAVLITNIRHKQALDLSLADIRRAISAIELGIPSDLVSEDLRLCINHLAEILGQITDNEVLSNIFKNFCIGK